MANLTIVMNGSLCRPSQSTRLLDGMRNPSINQDSSTWGKYSSRSTGGALFLEEFFDFGYVFGDVHAYGVVFDFGDADFPAIF